MAKPKVIIVGGGFGGLNAAKSLSKLDVEIVLIDRNNYHLFQPLLYQVATAALSATDIAAPIRRVLKKKKNVKVLMAEVLAIDPRKKEVVLEGERISYDYLILAPGSHYNYFGKDEWAQIAPSLKNIPDALSIRKMVLTAFEKAEMEEDPAKRQAYLNFVLVGGGPTGVELAGSIAELAHYTLTDDFRRIDTASTQIVLVEAGPRILAPFPDQLSEKARIRLEKMGVSVRTGTKVENVQGRGVVINGEFFPSRTVLWCAGVLASPLVQSLGVELDRNGRVPVRVDCSVAQYPEVFVIGDAAQFIYRNSPLPGLAPVAIQQGRHLQKVLAARMEGKTEGPPFRFFDKGTMATVGKAYAIVHFKELRFAGFFGWVLWIFVHIMYLVGFQNRALVLFQWAWQYLSFDRGSRIISK
jgi:NADH dehydrogenase